MVLMWVNVGIPNLLLVTMSFNLSRTHQGAPTERKKPLISRVHRGLLQQRSFFLSNGLFSLSRVQHLWVQQTLPSSAF